MNNIESFQTGNNNIVVEGTVVTVNENATLDDWKSFGESIKKAENGIQWILGAWWNYGHKKYSRDAEDFIKELGYRKQTLWNYGSVYKSVKPYCRREGLSYSHHSEVATLPPAKQEIYLAKAEKEGLGRDELRKVIRKAEKPELETKATKSYKITEKRLNEIKDRVSHIIELMSVSMLTLIPQSDVIAELKNLQTELNKFDI